MSTHHSKPLQFRRRNRSLNKHQSPVAAIRHISMILHKTTTILEPLQIRTHTHQIMTGRSRLKVLDGWQSQVSRLECFLEEMSVFFTNSPFKCFKVRHGLQDVPEKIGWYFESASHASASIPVESFDSESGPEHKASAFGSLSSLR
jgi:hypothetical protein